MKTTNELMKENNVKSLRLNNTDRQIFESYMTYVRADMRVNAHDSEKVLQRILDHLLKAENKGLHAMEFLIITLKNTPFKRLKRCLTIRLRIFVIIFYNISSFCWAYSAS